MTGISLRFAGGPLDGRIHQTTMPADEYRTVGGTYRRSRESDEATAIAYIWQPEPVGEWHTPQASIR